jgi:hypothetical protein
MRLSYLGIDITKSAVVFLSFLNQTLEMGCMPFFDFFGRLSQKEKREFMNLWTCTPKSNVYFA